MENMHATFTPVTSSVALLERFNQAGDSIARVALFVRRHKPAFFHCRLDSSAKQGGQ